MIDLKQELSEYNTIDLDDIARNGMDIPDSIRNSVILYNKAIESIRGGSEDIAIIGLKKAVSMNPHFYEAMNLLGVCYSYVNENARALEMFNKVVKAENNSVRALRYINMLDSGESSGQSRLKSRKKAAAFFEKDMNPENSTAGHEKTDTKGYRKQWLSILKIGAGFAAGAIITAVIYMSLPGPEKAADLSADTASSDTKTSQELENYKARYNDLEGKYELLQKDKDTANQQVDYYKSAIKLYEIGDMAAKKQYEAAADMLLLLKTVAFSGAEKEKFDALYSSVMPTAAWAVYNDGYSLYNRKNYEESYKKLEKVQIYDPGFESGAAVLYYMGRCSQQLNDARNAIALYQKLVDSYPDTSYAKNARLKLKQLIQNP